MIEILTYSIFFIYVLALIYIAVFCFMQFHLLFYYFKKNKNLATKDYDETNLPEVTIQLPVYNEKYVIERLIDNILSLDYPKEKLFVHILDDSTDETVLLAAEKINYYKNQGFHIEHLKRDDRTGFKAGALKEGMKYVHTDFVAIFDADFLPNADFLKRTIQYFENPNIGVIQTRWEHINQNYSLLTQMQAIQLNVHFTVEQKGRYQADYLLQFNGTAGIWRTKTIEDAGGWEADTLTEDLDLSYRAQMKGWQIMYLEDVTAPAELPVEINGLKSQQYRWMKGGAETAKKLLPKVWQDNNLRFIQKLHATMHLLASSIFIFVFLIGVFSVPLLILLQKVSISMGWLSAFLSSFAVIVVIYLVANVGVAWKRENLFWMIIKFIFLFPIFLSLSMGLAFHNSIAVLQGWRGLKTSFVRTPKFGITKNFDFVSKRAYFSSKMDSISIWEGILFLYFLVALICSIYFQIYYFLLLHILLTFGYLTLFLYAIKSRISK